MIQHVFFISISLNYQKTFEIYNTYKLQAYGRPTQGAYCAILFLQNYDLHYGRRICSMVNTKHGWYKRKENFGSA